MTASLFSSRWFRVADLKPRLRAQVRVQRQAWRGQRWYLLTDMVSGRHHRLNESAHEFIGRCDGRRSVREVWHALLEQQPDAAPTQDEVVALLGQLDELELLQAGRAADARTLLQRRDLHQRRRRRGLLNPFSLRLPLADPMRWLQRLDPWAQRLFQPGVLAAWAVLVMLALLLAGLEWPALRQHGAQLLGSSGSLALAWLIYPVMKALHELGHALAVRRWGGEVRECGIGLMFLVPAPYVDASAATAFPRRHQRMAVGAAGVMVELGLAALGLVLWVLTQPGLVHDAAFVVMAIGAGSTLFFNGNPLLKFDAYHVVCDLFALPNLAARSHAWWSHALARLLLGGRAEWPAHAPGERRWLWAYAPLSWVYRLVLSVAVVTWLGGQWVLLGLAAAAYVGFTVLLQPLQRWATQAMAGAQPGRELARLRLRLGLVAATAALAVFVLPLPLPLTTVAPAIVWLPDEAQLRAEVDGFVQELPVPDGAMVQPGDLVMRLSNPELESQRGQQAQRLEGLRVQQAQRWLGDPAAAQNLALDIQRAQAELARLDERIAHLQVRSAVAGRLTMPRQADLLGSHRRRGDTLGHVLAPGSLRVRAAVAEADAHLVRQHTRSAQVRLYEAPGRPLRALPHLHAAAATHQLPSAALADRGGGPHRSDPAQPDGTRSLLPVVLVDLAPQDELPLRVGGRAWVRFEHGHEPLALQAQRRAAQLFLRHFTPGATR